MPSTRHSHNVLPRPVNEVQERSYIGDASKVIGAKLRRGRPRLPTPAPEGRVYIGNIRRPSPEVPLDNNELFEAEPSISAVTFVLEKNVEELQGGGYVGQRISRKRTIAEIISSEDEQQEESEPESIQPSPSKRVLRKRRVVEVESSDEDEQPPRSSTLPSNERDDRISSTPELPNVSYMPTEEEIPEDDSLEVFGETAPEDTSDDSEEDIPIRLLKDFSVYDLTPRRRLVRFDRYLCTQTTHSLGASGIVERYVNDEDDDESQTSDEEDNERLVQRVALSGIKEISVHAVSTEGAFELDPKVYLRTEYAWYILDTPSEGYEPFYAEFATSHCIFNELINAAREDRQINRKEFLERLQSLEDTDHDFTEAELQSTSIRSYILSSFNDLKRDCRDPHPRTCARLLTVPAVAELVQPPKPISTAATSSVASSSGSRAKPYSPKKPKSSHSAPVSTAGSGSTPVREKPQAPEPTVVTPRIYEICKDLYPENEFLVVGSSRQDRLQLSAEKKQRHPTHEDDPNRIEWIRETKTVPNHYRSVTIDGVRYDVGDSVMVEPGEDENKKRAAALLNFESSNPLATTKWFARICYMYQDVSSTDKYAHVQYYVHGAANILREAAHPYQLFLVDECMDVNLESIYQKVNIHPLDPMEDEPLVTKKDNVYLTGLYWDDHNTKFFHRQPEEEARAQRRCKRGRQCVSCGMNKLHGDLEEWQYRDGAYVQQDVVYHVNDFVYIRPELHETDVYVIAQIVQIQPSEDVEKKYHSVDLRVYQRCDLVTRHETKQEFGEREMDERRLFRSDTFLDDYDVRYIEGKVFVLHRAEMSDEELDDWATYDDHFYVDCKADSDKPRSTEEFEKLSPRSFKKCTECIEARRDYVAEQKLLMETHKPLRGLELFAGAGGLSTGFDESRFVKTLWAVELGSSASKTYTANHPYSKVYNHSVNKVLQHAIETFEGNKPERLYSERGDKLPLMPKPGDVDFIYGGPPCQGFSRMNHTKTVDDYRNTLVCNMLSYVDFYRPKFFMLENVEGILYHPLAATQTGPGAKMEGGVRMGVVKLILRVLISLGYQAHFKLLQAGQYGAPQSRLRVIFLGAKCDIPLPRFPIPTHCTADDVQHVRLETGNLLRPVVRVVPSDDKEIESRRSWLQFAPLLRVSVEDAISDLPRFDWISPCAIITEPDDMYEIAQRQQQGIRRFDAVKRKGTNDPLYSGYTEAEPYHSDPLSRYQKWMRKSVREDQGVATVQYQYTQRYRASVVESVVNVPIRPDANHTDLPEPLRNPVWFEEGKIHGKSKSAYTSIYGRVNGKWHFQTALTSANPNAKGGRLLHPTQKRVLTIREFARAQGFPDHQEFLSWENDVCPDQIRQIGNAVPVPLASALGKSIGSVLTSMWLDEDAREQANREVSPEIPMDIE